MAAEQDAFEQLEQRIQRAVAHTLELRAENARLRADLEGMEIRATEAESAADDMAHLREAVQKLETEIATLHKEREGVRSRVEKLLKQIEALS